MRRRGRHVLAIASVESEGGLRLHKRLGFREVGRMKEVGFKFGRWIDVVITQRMLSSGSAADVPFTIATMRVLLRQSGWPLID